MSGIAGGDTAVARRRPGARDRIGAFQRFRALPRVVALLIAGGLASCGHAPMDAPTAPAPTPPAVSPKPAAPAVAPQPVQAPAAPAPAPAPVGPPEGFPSARYAPGAERGGRVYEITPAESQLDIYVYRAGRLQRFGHNHIITSRDVAGLAFHSKEAGRSHFDLYLPVDTLSVDEPELRAAAGDAFASQPSESDIAGTRRNMLSEKMLNAAQFPWIRVAGRSKAGTPDAPELEVTITVRGIAHTAPATAKVERDGNTLRATGELRLSHAELGLEPFSVLGGALSVEDAFDIRYRITAHAR